MASKGQCHILVSVVLLISSLPSTEPACRVSESRAGLCVFPFIYRNIEYHGCTTNNYHRYWCAFNREFVDGAWANCSEIYTGTPPIVKTSDGRTCRFPFQFEDQLFYSCTIATRDRLWCSTSFQFSPAASDICQDVCDDTFNAIPNTGWSDGVLVDRVRDVTVCENFCLCDDDCVAFEVSSDRRCYMFTETKANQQTDSTLYVRRRCTPPSTTPVLRPVRTGCSTQEFRDRNADGGLGIPGIRDAQDCETECLLRPYCLAFDYDRTVAPVKCFLHFRSVVRQRAMDVYHTAVTCPVRQGSTPAPACRYTYTKNTDRHGFDGELFREVTTATDCTNECDRNPSGRFCYAVDFVLGRRECYLYFRPDYIKDPRRISQVDHYTRSSTCVSPGVTGAATTPRPSCQDTFRRISNALAYGGRLKTGQNSIPRCLQTCKADNKCVGFDFVRRQTACWLHFDPNLRREFNPRGNGVDHYQRIRCDASPSDNCRQEYVETVDRNAINGQLQGVVSLVVCQNRCSDNSSCYGLDFSRTNRECYLLFYNYTLNVNPLPGVSNYRKVLNCGSTTVPTTRETSCRDSFTRRIDRHGYNGTYQGLVTTIAECEEICLSFNPGMRRVCYGFDFNSLDMSCWLYYGETIQLGDTRGVTHSRRTFRCATVGTVPPTVPPGCEDGYIRTENRNADGGTFQPTVSTVAGCQDVCDATAVRCHGFDFSRDGNTCFIFLRNFTLNTDIADGVDNYRRSDTCEEECLDKFEPTRNRNAVGGVLQDGVQTVTACRRRCNRLQPGDEQTCYGFDFNTRDLECWLFLEQYNLREVETPDVDNYKREFTCQDTRACFDQFSVSINRYAIGGEQQTSVTTLQGCREKCRESRRGQDRVCYGFDFDTSNICWIQFSNYTLADQLRPNVNNSRRIFTCDSLGSECLNPYLKTTNANAVGGERQTSITTLSGCQTECDTPPDGRLCYGLDFTDSGQCWLHFSNYTVIVRPGQAVNNYRKNRNCTQEECLDKFDPTRNRNAVGGVLQDGVQTVTACRRRCNRLQPGDEQTCYGFDFNTRDLECWLFLEQYNLREVETPDVDNYKREFTCQDTRECRNPYLETTNANAVGGERQTSITTLSGCQTECDTPPDGRLCYGLDFTDSGQCWLHFSNYTVIVRPGQAVNNYRKNRNCTQGCEYFNRTVNNQAPGGILQEDINSLSACRQRCLTTQLGTVVRCYGFDYSTQSNRCWFFLQQYTLRTRNVGVDNYRRNFDCALPKKCTEFTPTPNSNARGGDRLTSLVTVPVCTARCRDLADCYGFDFVPGEGPEGACWLHMSNFTTSFSSGVTNYRRNFQCALSLDQL